MRDFHHRTTPDMPPRADTHRKLLLEARAARQAGLAANSPQARELAERAAAGSAGLVAAMTGKHDPENARRAITESGRTGKAAQWPAKSAGVKLLTRTRQRHSRE
ncbi:hypothetical protein [Amycolatopsis sp. NBC_00438]|uniref:hypothetical protein n=1 Tax=Amycolatopsis sp. NBC_00438 TaxID=2903558 RepID=UPI002E1A7010